MSNPYIVFVGNTADNLQPFESAPTKEAAISRAKELQEAFVCVEAVYMPEDDVDVNDVVYSVK